MKTPPAITNLDQLPVILTLREICGIYRISPSTVRKGLQLGTFRPRPFEWYPYRWKLAHVVADLDRERDERTVRNHGFRARALKAPLVKKTKARRTGTR